MRRALADLLLQISIVQFFIIVYRLGPPYYTLICFLLEKKVKIDFLSMRCF